MRSIPFSLKEYSSAWMLLFTPSTGMYVCTYMYVCGMWRSSKVMKHVVEALGRSKGPDLDRVAVSMVDVATKVGSEDAVSVCVCVCILHINRPGLNHTQLCSTTRLPNRCLVTKSYKDRRATS